MRINIKWLQTGGVPLTNDVMAVVMDAIATYNVLGDLAGNLTILEGCTLNGQNVSPGFVVINSDILYFEGGIVYDSVYVHTEPISKTFQDAIDKVLIETKSVKFGNATEQYLWSDFVRLETLKEIQTKVNNSVTQQQLNVEKARIDKLEMKTAPIINGGIVWIWKLPASEIPVGWKECTDLRGKTVFGRDPDDPDFSNLGLPGGNKTKTLLQTNLPTLSASTSVVQPYSGESQPGGGFDGGNNPWYNRNKTFSFGGNSTPINIINPHRIVNFIEPNFQ